MQMIFVIKHNSMSLSLVENEIPNVAQMFSYFTG